MLEFKLLQELELNAEILELLKDYTYTIKTGKIKPKIDPDNVLKEYVIELSSKLEGTTNSKNIISNKELYGFVFEHLNRKSKKELIKKVIENI